MTPGDDAPAGAAASRGPSKEAWGAITAIAVALISAAVTLATHFWSTGARYTVEVEVAPECALGARCGTIAVSHVPCRGSLFLSAQDGGDFEFRVDDFVPPSAPACSAGAGEHLRAQPDGTLLYTTSYEPRARAVLARRGGGAPAEARRRASSRWGERILRIARIGADTTTIDAKGPARPPAEDRRPGPDPDDPEDPFSDAEDARASASSRTRCSRPRSCTRRWSR